MNSVEPASATPEAREQAPPVTAVKPDRPARPGRKNRDWLHGLLMSMPAVAGLIAFVAIPFGYAVVLSFYNVRLGSPLPPSFVGLEQYRAEAVMVHPFGGPVTPALCYTLPDAPPPDERNPEYAARLQRVLAALDFPSDYIASIPA